MFSVYVIYSKHYNKIYIGFTSDLKERLISHNHPNNKGWTKRFQPWELFHVEEFPSKQIAMKREKQLKRGKGREFIWSHITEKYRN